MRRARHSLYPRTPIRSWTSLPENVTLRDFDADDYDRIRYFGLEEWGASEEIMGFGSEE